MKFKSPFKFLDPYDKADHDYFFGREKEVDLLYDFVNKNRVVLLYGQSGTGKTSIIQCGLANEFDVTDWIPFFIRRGDNLNESLTKSLTNNNPVPTEEEIRNLSEILFNDVASSKIKNQINPQNDDDEKIFIATLIYNIQKTAERFLRPLYLIFDQFEELLILGSGSEKKLFIKTLKTLLGPHTIVDCHIIIVMREEYFAWLDSFEEDIPGISDRRLRIEPMRTKEIRTVILDSCREFKIQLTDPENNVTQMVDALSKRGDVALPYLQVYLDQLWRKDYERTYPEGYQGKEKFIPLVFTTEEIMEFGEIKDVMQRFLLEQKKIFEDKVKDRFPGVPDNYLNKMLDCFVNDEGTKMPNAYYVENGFYKFKKKSSRFLRETNPELINFTLEFLQSSQILRNEGNTFELGHDILAKLIDKQRDAKQQRLNGIRVMISIHKKSGEMIPYDLARNWERYIDLLDLKDDEKAFFYTCKNEGERKEHEKLYEEEVKRALEKKEVENRLALEKKEVENKLALEKKEVENRLALEKRENEFKFALIKRKSNRNRWLLACSVIFICFLALGFWNALKTQNSYYAIDFISSLDTVSNKMDALNLAKYVYDFKKYDERKERIITESIKKIVSSPYFAKKFSKAGLRLKSASTLANGLDIDISGDGKFISVRNDSLQSQNQNGSFLVLNANTNKVIHTFRNIKYSYFLNGSDTLLLALSDSSTILSNYYPDRFILYDCVRRSVIKTIRLNNSGNSTNLLYGKDYLNKNSFTEWDSYKVRLMSSGCLVIPYLNFENGDQGVMLYDLASKEARNAFNGSSNFSVSISRKSDKILYAYKTAKQLVFESYSNDGTRHIPISDARYADFTENGSIVFTKQNVLYVVSENGTILKRFHSKPSIRRVLAGGDENYALALDDANMLNLISFNDTLNLQKFNETLIGYNLNKKTFITQSRFVDEKNNDSIKLILRDFSGRELKRDTIDYGIESVSFNINTNSILLKTNKLANSNFQLLYLFDDTLGLKGTFFLTPNDSYGFSSDGKSFFFVRDNELSVFDNKKYLDLSNFESVNGWLEEEKHKIEKYEAWIKKVRISHGIDPFPTQRIGL